MTHYLIYKITNNLNGKIYIGKHQTDNLDDGYMGSGVAINTAIMKYGKENFSKEILYDVEDEELMNFIEELIVDEEFVKREDTYNIALGGIGGGHPLSEEAKQKISKAHKGKPLSEEHKLKMSQTKKGRKKSQETRKKMSEAQRGRKCMPMSEEQKRKLSETFKGEKNPFYGKKHSEESRKKMAEAKLGRHLKPFSEEHRKKISEALKGKPHYQPPFSEESKRKMSEARKRYWALRNKKVEDTVNENP